MSIDDQARRSEVQDKVNAKADKVERQRERVEKEFYANPSSRHGFGHSDRFAGSGTKSHLAHPARGSSKKQGKARQRAEAEQQRGLYLMEQQLLAAERRRLKKAKSGAN